MLVHLDGIGSILSVLVFFWFFLQIIQAENKNQFLKQTNTNELMVCGTRSYKIHTIQWKHLQNPKGFWSKSKKKQQKNCFYFTQRYSGLLHGTFRDNNFPLQDPGSRFSVFVSTIVLSFKSLFIHILFGSSFSAIVSTFQLNGGLSWENVPWEKRYSKYLKRR